MYFPDEPEYITQLRQSLQRFIEQEPPLRGATAVRSCIRLQIRYEGPVSASLPAIRMNPT